MPFKRIRKAVKKVGRVGRALAPIGKAALSMSPAGQAAMRVGRRIKRGMTTEQLALGKSMMHLAGVGAYALENAAANDALSIPGPIAGTNAVMNPKTANVPRFKNSDVDLVISRSEYITDLVSGTGTPTAFDLSSYEVNPGLSIEDGGVFKWLPNVASNFQQYEFKQLCFEYRPTSGMATGSNTALGTVTLSGAYDPLSNIPQDKSDMLNQQFAISGTPANEIIYPVECKKSEHATQLLNIRTGALTPQQNAVNYDYLRLDVASNAIPTANQVLGELWVTYTVRLSKYSSYGSSQRVRTANYRWTGTAGDGPQQTSYLLGLGTGASVLTCPATNQLPLTFDYGTGTIYLPPAISSGIYEITIYWRANNAAQAWVGGAVAYTNCTGIACVFSPTSVGGQAYGYENSITTPTSKVFSFSQIIKVTSPGAAYQLTTGWTLGLAGVITDCNVIVTELNPLSINQGL